MSGVTNTVGGGVHMTDDRRRAFIPGETAGLGTKYEVRGGDDLFYRLVMDALIFSR